jgi:tetratricopeptide (TPR) repeat protein
LRAGDHARGLFANERALAHYRSALALGHPDPALLHEAAGDLLTLLGDYRAAVESYEAAAAYAPPSGTARLEHKLGGVYDRWGRWDQAGLHLEAAVRASEGSEEQARILADWSLTAYRKGNRAEAAELIQAAQRSAERAGDRRALSQCHNVLGILARAEGDPARAREQLELSLNHAEALGDPVARAAALNNLALALGDLGEVDQAIGAAKQALELSEPIGDRHRAAALYSNLADLLHRAGDETQAKAHLRESARRFAEIGVEPGQFEPEIWKLVEW